MTESILICLSFLPWITVLLLLPIIDLSVDQARTIDTYTNKSSVFIENIPGRTCSGPSGQWSLAVHGTHCRQFESVGSCPVPAAGSEPAYQCLGRWDKLGLRPTRQKSIHSNSHRQPINIFCWTRLQNNGNGGICHNNHSWKAFKGSFIIYNLILYWLKISTSTLLLS